MLENIEVELTVVVGSAEMKIRDLLRLNEGSVIELDRLAGDPLDILANGTIIAKGEWSWWASVSAFVFRNCRPGKTG